MFENTGLVNCPCCGNLIEVHNNGIMGWSAYIPVFNRCNTQTSINFIKDYMTNPTISLYDQWVQKQNDRSNNK